MLSSSDFHWLSDIDMSGTNAATAMASTTVVSLSTTGELTVFTSSLSRTFLYDTTWYFGTAKSWICPVVEYPIINPVRAYRFVSVFNFTIVLYHFSDTNFPL